MLDKEPAQWLVSSLGRKPWFAWGIVAFSGCVMVVLCLAQDIPIDMSNGFVLKPFAFVLKISFAFEACRFFIESRRAGTLELLLCTPLGQKNILWGQIRAFRKAALWPCIVFGLFMLAPDAISAYAGPSGAMRDPFTIMWIGIGFLELGVDVIAICWVGMRFALYMKKPQHAPAMTILVVLIAPSVLCWLDLIANAALISWAASGLARDWRELLLTGGSSTPPPIPDNPSRA